MHCGLLVLLSQDGVVDAQDAGDGCADKDTLVAAINGSIETLN